MPSVQSSKMNDGIWRDLFNDSLNLTGKLKICLDMGVN